MGIFSKSVTDEEWLNKAKPMYLAAWPLTAALDEAVASESMEGEVSALQDALSKLPIIYESVKLLPEPTSSEARRAHKNMKSAMKDYAEATKQGATFLRDLGGGPGERLSWGGVSRRAAAGRLAFSKTLFEDFAKSARRPMAEAAAYFSTQ